jgi:protein-S-isoprenylcysteine O-methyltransferase Ste14
VVPWEERNLEARFGEAYLRYKHSVPRWLGRRSR